MAALASSAAFLAADLAEGAGGRERKGEEGSHAGLPTPFYNYVEYKLRNTNLCPFRAFDWALIVM